MVAHSYGFFSDNPPVLKTAILEMTDHVFIPLVLFFGLFYIAAFKTIRRLENELVEFSKDALVAADSLSSYQLPINTLPAEIRPFAEALNLLTARLESHARKQEAFAADAAHELKTPLSILALELDKLSAEEAGRLGAQVRSLSNMIDQLLVLAISNSPDMEKKQCQIDPDLIGRRLVEELAPAVIDSGKSISFESKSPQKFYGLEEAIYAALRTIIDNALRVTPKGGEVCIVAGPGPRFTISDGGSGIETQQLYKLKARGVRADHAPGGTAGLGLAIADRIVSAHGGDLVSCMPQQAALRLDFSLSQ